jgi:type II secretory pathway pseudopilin PulG
MYNTRGVTVVKMLLTVIIIMIVIMGVYMALDATQKQSRDTKRIADIKTLHKALSIYQTLYGNFPITNEPVDITGEDMVSIALLNSNSMEDAPRDPMHPTYDYVYSTNSVGNDFTIQFCLEGNSLKEYEAGCDNYIKP